MLEFDALGCIQSSGAALQKKQFDIISRTPSSVTLDISFAWFASQQQHTQTVCSRRILAESPLIQTFTSLLHN